MPRIFITSGTSYQLPADFNPSNNTIECYGGGTPGQGNQVTTNNGGGGGAYAAVTNINLGANTYVQIQIGSAGATDTYFNATSLANAVSNGPSVSCGAQGANGSTGGAASSSCGVTKYNGGAGGASSSGAGGANGTLAGGGGGGGCGGPNGPGAAGAAGGGYYSGGGGGGANNGAAGSVGSNSGGNGGNGRGGSGGGSGGSSGGSIGNAGASNSGGGGGGGTTVYVGGAGALDDVYGTGVYGPGGGGGGGGSEPLGANGGGSYGFGAGGAAGFGSVGNASETDGLIVITYVPAPPGTRNDSPFPGILTLRSPSIHTAATIKSKLDALTPNKNMSWYKQPELLMVPSKQFAIPFCPLATAQSWQNLTPPFAPPFAQPLQMLWHPQVLDYRQQFPGLAPRDFHLTVSENNDTISSFINLKSFINSQLTEYDTTISNIVLLPATGSSSDVIRRVKLVLPKGWWGYTAPIRDAIIGGIADGASWCYSLFSWVKSQTRVAWATGVFLDIISKDYFGVALPRKINEQDASFRTRIQKELIRERVTRKGMFNALQDLTGNPPSIFEPWNTGDTGAWDQGSFALDAGGGWGDTILPAQSFLNVVPPGAGIIGAPGWDTASLGWDIGGEWGDMSQIAGTITNQDIYDTINKTRATGSIAWTQLFPVAKPVPPPSPPSLTLPMLVPGWCQPSVWHPFMQQPTMPMPQVGGFLAINPASPNIEPPWLIDQPPIYRPTIAIAEMPTGYGGSLAHNPVTPSFAPPVMNAVPIIWPKKLQDWMPIDYGGAQALNLRTSLLPWLSTSPVVQPGPGAYSIPVMPDSVNNV